MSRGGSVNGNGNGKPKQEQPSGASKDRRVLGQTSLFFITKYSTYGYQVFKYNPETGKTSKVSIENTYGVVASDMIDLMFVELSGGKV